VGCVRPCVAVVGDVLMCAAAASKLSGLKLGRHNLSSLPSKAKPLEGKLLANPRFCQKP
jgi:hypothetical protein